MNDKLFIPQSVLDKWVESGKVVFTDNHLTLLNEKKTYTLTSAVRFMSLLDGQDTHKLLGRLRTLDKLLEIKAEHRSDSVILGETAYQVQEGFIAVVLADEEVSAPATQALKQVTIEKAQEPPPPAVVAASTKAPPPPEKPVEITATPATESADAELLTKFLLNNLNF